MLGFDLSNQNNGVASYAIGKLFQFFFPGFIEVDPKYLALAYDDTLAGWSEDLLAFPEDLAFGGFQASSPR